jgi:hypothetical protein
MKRACVITIALGFALATAASAASDCSHKLWNWKVDQKAARQLQQSVNEGHEPWRMNDINTLAGNVIQERKHNWADYNTVLEMPIVISQSKERASLVAKSKDGRLSNKVTLRKYPWLMHSARR